MKKDSISVSLSTLGGSSGFSTTSMTGYVHAVYVSVSSALPAASKATITSESTRNIVLVIKPSTNGGLYYPRNSIHGSTGNVIASTVLVAGSPFFQDRFRYKVSSSSGNSGATLNIDLFVE